MLRFNPKRKHSSSYYRSTLQIIVAGLVNNWPQSTIRAALAGSGLSSPTNGEWTEAALSGVLARMRQRSGPFFVNLLSMHLAGEVSTSDVAHVLRSH